MSRRVTGVLRTPDNNGVSGASIKFVASKFNLSGVPIGVSTEILTGDGITPDISGVIFVMGKYDVDILEGSYHVYYKLAGHELYSHLTDIFIDYDPDNPGVSLGDPITLEELFGQTLPDVPVYEGCDNIPPPSDLTVTSGFTSIILKWQAATYTCHSVTEIHYNTVDDLDGAALLDTTEGAVYSHEIGHGDTFYYWIRFRNLNNIVGDWYLDNGMSGTTSLDPGEVLDKLQQSVYNSAIFTELRTGINSSFYQPSRPDVDGIKPNGDPLVSGDTWINSDTGQRNVWDTSNTEWLAVTDIELTDALIRLSATEEVADGEIKRFFQVGTPSPASFGDIWIDTDINGVGEPPTFSSIFRYQDEDGRNNPEKPLDWRSATENALGRASVQAYNTENSLIALHTEYNTFVDTTLPADILAIQNQIDGNITTWFGDADPTLINTPSDDWEEVDSDSNDYNNYSQHVGDVFYNRASGQAFRFVYEDVTPTDGITNVVYSWVLITDNTIAAALAKASTAQDTADDKRRVFVIQPTGPYDKGDLWSNGTELKKCKTTNTTTGAFSEDEWELATSYITTYFAQDTAELEPSSPNTGDMWMVTDASENVIDTRRYDGSTWISLTLATLANVDTKIVEQVGYCERTVTATGDTNRTGAYTTKTLCEAAVVTGETFAWRDTGALASRTDIVSSTVGDHTSSISTQATSINGLESMYSVKLDNNGTVSGFGLSSGTSGCLVNGVLDDTIAESDCVDYTWNPTAVNADTSVGVCLVVGVEDLNINETECTTLGGRKWVTDSSTFLVAADYFAITSPTNKDADGNLNTPTTPFVVRTGGLDGRCYVDGSEVTVADLGLDPASITMGEVLCTSSEVRGSWVGAGVGIVGIQGDLVLDGTLNANKIVAGSITGDHIAGTTITSNHLDTNNAFIGMTIQSANYVAADANGNGGTGWVIDNAGNAEFATGSFGGSVRTNQLISHDGAGFDIDAAGQAGPTNDANIWGGVIKGAVFEAGYLVEMGDNTYTEHYVLTNPNCSFADILVGKYRYPRVFGNIISSPGYNSPVSARTHTYDVYAWNRCTNTLRRLNAPTADITVVSTTGLLNKSFSASCVCNRDTGTKTYSVAVTTPNGTTETFTFSGRAWFDSSWGFHRVYVNGVLVGTADQQQGSNKHYSGTDIINGVSISWEVDVNTNDYFDAYWPLDSISGYYTLTMKIHINQSTLSNVSMTGNQVFKFTTTGGPMKIPPVSFV